MMMEGFFLGMKFQDYVASQFDVKLITEGKYAGRVCFKTPVGISVFHCCNDCEHKLIAPRDVDCSDFELLCKLNKKEVNREGGLTECDCFKETN